MSPSGFLKQSFLGCFNFLYKFRGGGSVLSHTYSELITGVLHGLKPKEYAEEVMRTQTFQATSSFTLPPLCWSALMCMEESLNPLLHVIFVKKSGQLLCSTVVISLYSVKEVKRNSEIELHTCTDNDTSAITINFEEIVLIIMSFLLSLLCWQLVSLPLMKQY